MVEKQVLKLFFGRLFIFILLATSIITLSILANQFGPPSVTYSDDAWEDLDPVKPRNYNSSKYNVVLDQHSHTLYSDGILTVKQNIEWHIAMGYNAFFITDHNTVAHKDDIEDLKDEYEDDGIIVMLGIEWTTYRIHMNFLGVEEWDDPIPSEPTDKEIQDAIDEAHDQGAVVTVNHIPWSLNEAGMDDHPSRDELFEWGIDYIEIVNGDDYDQNSIDWYDELNPADQEKIGFITGTDMHSPGKVYGWTFIDADTLSEKAIMAELRDLNTTISYSSIGKGELASGQINPLYVIMMPLMEFGGLFVPLWHNGSLDWTGVLAYLGYAFGIFALIEVHRVVKPKFKAKLNARKEISETPSER